MKNFLFCLFFGFIFKSNAQEINVDYFNNFGKEINGVGNSSNVKNYGNIQTQSLSGRYHFTDKYSIGIGLNYGLNKIIVGWDFDGDSFNDYHIDFRNNNFELYFSPTFKIPTKKIKKLEQYLPELFFSYCIGIGKSSTKVYHESEPSVYYLTDEFQDVTIPSFFQLQASVPLNNSFSLNISMRGAQRNLDLLKYYDLFAIRPVQVGFGIGYKFNSFKSRNTKGTREVI